MHSSTLCNNTNLFLLPFRIPNIQGPLPMPRQPCTHEQKSSYNHPILPRHPRPRMPKTPQHRRVTLMFGMLGPFSYSMPPFFYFRCLYLFPCPCFGSCPTLRPFSLSAGRGVRGGGTGTAAAHRSSYPFFKLTLPIFHGWIGGGSTSTSTWSTPCIGR